MGSGEAGRPASPPAVSYRAERHVLRCLLVRDELGVVDPPATLRDGRVASEWKWNLSLIVFPAAPSGSGTVDCAYAGCAPR